MDTIATDGNVTDKVSSENGNIVLQAMSDVMYKIGE